MSLSDTPQGEVETLRRLRRHRADRAERALREAKRIELRAGDAAVLLPSEGVAKALADDPLQCQ